jgi:hypothetical protein
MRCCIAILLAVVFGWMLMLPAFGGSAESNLPACCRKNGKHHCAMLDRLAAADASFAAVKGRCPSFPRATAAGHTKTFKASNGQAIFAGIVGHPTVSPQTEAGYRVSHFRSKQKRGPPSSLLS